MVKTNTIVFGWNRVQPGREAMAGELFGQAMSFYERQKQAGKLESYEPLFMERHGGDLNGFFLIKGTHTQINELSINDEFQEIVVRADHMLSGVGVIRAYTGPQAIADLMQLWTKNIPRS